MNPCELTAAITALANLLAARMTVDQLNMLGVELTQLADTLFTIATQRGICEAACSACREQCEAERAAKSRVPL